MRWLLGILIRFVLRWLGRLVLVLALLGVGLWIFGPREAVVVDAGFDPAVIGADPAAYLAAEEAKVAGIRPGVEKRIHWAGAAGVRTPLAVVYVHGFSATSEEIRPVPDRVAEALGANLVYTRLAGHGRDGAAMAEPKVGDWMRDTAEALAVGRAVGDRVIVISTSTGGTLMAEAAVQPALMEQVAGLVFVSPNYGVNNPAAPLLTLPGARWFLPLLVGAERSFEPRNEAHGTYWTTQYPTVALIPMAALVEHAVALDFSQARVPALFMFSDADQVVRADLTREVIARWAGAVTVVPASMGPDDDPNAHVIAGDIQSPGQTAGAVKAIVDWAGRL